MLSSAGWSGGCSRGSWWDHTHTRIMTSISLTAASLSVLTCTVEELGQFKSFRQNSSNSSLSSSLEKILSISWNDVDRNINSILFNCIQYSQTSGRQFYGNLLINDLMNLSWGMKTEDRRGKIINENLILKVSNVNIAISRPKHGHLLTLKVWKRVLKYKINLWYHGQHISSASRI